MKEQPTIFSGEMIKAILDGRKTQTRRPVKGRILELIEGFSGRCDDVPATTEDLGQEWKDGKFRIWCAEYPEEGMDYISCPYGSPGDRLWVRESWRVGAWDEDNCLIAVDYCADGACRREWLEVKNDELFERLWIQSTDDAIVAGLKYDEDGQYHWKPGEAPTRRRASIHMPRWASRITIEITNIRIERLQEISAEDAEKEGIEKETAHGQILGWKNYLWHGHIGLAITQKQSDSWEWQYSTYTDKPVGCFSSLWDKINAKKYPWKGNPWVWVIEFRRAICT